MANDYGERDAQSEIEWMGMSVQPRPTHAAGAGGTPANGVTDLDSLQRQTFDYFLHEANLSNGLIRDKTAVDWPASIAATGLALACYPVAVARGFMSRAAAVERTLVTLRFFWDSPQGPESNLIWGPPQ